MFTSAFTDTSPTASWIDLTLPLSQFQHRCKLTVKDCVKLFVLQVDFRIPTLY